MIDITIREDCDVESTLNFIKALSKLIDDNYAVVEHAEVRLALYPEHKGRKHDRK